VRLAAQSLPRVRIALPAIVSTENVQIVYFMTGAFGGYGNFVNVEKGRADYEVVAAVKDVPAKTFKLIAYLPGCQIEIRDERIQFPESTMQLDCIPLAQIRLRGRVAPSSKVHPGDKVEINYLAEWGFDFFGYADGSVTSFHIADTDLDPDGFFDFSVPDLFAQSGLGEGEFKFLLLEGKSGGFPTNLHPVDGASPFRDLKVQAIYPSIIRFAAD
jgi:hypothetical protein